MPKIDIDTVNWNNKPALGALIGTYNLISGWNEFPTGTAGAICGLTSKDAGLHAVFVKKRYPDENFSYYNYWSGVGDCCAKSALPYYTECIRSFIKWSDCPPDTVLKFQLKAIEMEEGASNLIEFRDVNYDSFEIGTVTWNNQPDMGTLLNSFSMIEGEVKWVEINVGSKVNGAFGIKFAVEDDLYHPQIESYVRPLSYLIEISEEELKFRSSDYMVDPNQRPYFTNE